MIYFRMQMTFHDNSASRQQLSTYSTADIIWQQTTRKFIQWSIEVIEMVHRTLAQVLGSSACIAPAQVRLAPRWKAPLVQVCGAQMRSCDEKIKSCF